MAYFEDLTLYRYANANETPPSLNIGWLDASNTFPQGESSIEFREKLLSFCKFKYTVHHCWGYHECEFCEEPEFSVIVQRGDERFQLGNGEIRVIGNVIYAAPTLIYHYVVAHKYLPPNEFIEAVLIGPSPGSEEHLALIKKINAQSGYT